MKQEEESSEPVKLRVKARDFNKYAQDLLNRCGDDDQRLEDEGELARRMVLAHLVESMRCERLVKLIWRAGVHS